MIKIVQAETGAQVEEARKIFREYEKWLGLDLCFQSFEDELKNLPGRYSKPEGRLFLALAGEKAAGCVALRKIDAETCEMKRLFVRPEFRGLGVGKKLVEKIISAAGNVGYRKMRLDTYPPKMPKAVEIYKSYGFREIPAYYHNPFGETLFMEKDLKAKM